MKLHEKRVFRVHEKECNKDFKLDKDALFTVFEFNQHSQTLYTMTDFNLFSDLLEVYE